MMKKLLTTMMACCALTCAEAQTNLSPEVNAYLSNYKKAEKTRSADAAKQTIVTLRLKPGAQPADVASRVEALGAEVKVTLGNQMTVALTGDILEKVAATEGVDIVEILSKATPRTDKSREVTQADKVISGTGDKLPQAYTGEGVIIALIDGGYDFTHPAFKDENGKLRIKSVYLSGQNLTSGKKAVIDGKEIEGTLFDTPEEILDTLKLMDDSGTHGTHCAACATASEVKGITGLSGKPLGGMAPKADIILINSSTDKNMIAKYGEDQAASLAESLAFKYISEYGKAQNKPVVLSWSENQHDGFHDGTSATAQTVKNFCAEGNIAVICASNEGSDSMHIHKTVNAGETLKLMCNIIQHSSDTDEGTAKAPHRFGAGKINAYKGLLSVLDLSTGIEGLSQQQPEGVSFRVENGQLIVEGAEDGTAVTLYNLSGTIVSQTTVQAGSVSLDGLQKGVYAVQLGKLGSTLIRL